jgi:hypothetical protein
VEFVTPRIGNNSSAVLCAENNVIVQADVRHLEIPRTLSACGDGRESIPVVRKKRAPRANVLAHLQRAKQISKIHSNWEHRQRRFARERAIGTRTRDVFRPAPRKGCQQISQELSERSERNSWGEVYPLLAP